MTFQRITRTGIALVATAVLVVSCVTTKKVAYLQDMEHETQISLEDKFEAVISPYDELDILVSSFDPELAKPFNLISAITEVSGSAGSDSRFAYLVDQDGNIDFPVLGTLHVEGLTRLKLQDQIKDLLIHGGYISDPFVMVRFRNFKIFFLGSNGGKAITVPNERCTFLEALALSGDLNVYTNRAKIAVLREMDGQMVMRYLDPRSSKVFSDPFYMLQQNDFIITRDTDYGNFMQSFTQWSPFFTMFTTIFTTVTSVFSLYLTSRMIEIYSR
jgi:polysaccharide export outer membrane protein